MKAALDLAGQPTANLGRQVAAVDLVHDAAHAAQHETRLARVAVVAVGDADDTDAAMLKATHHLFLVDLVTGEAIETFEDEDVELGGQCRGVHGGAAGALGHRHRAAGRLIGEDLGDRQPVGASPRSAGAGLVIDRGAVLLVGREAGVDRGGRHVRGPLERRAAGRGLRARSRPQARARSTAR